MATAPSSHLCVSVKPPAAKLSKPAMDKKESFSISKIWMRGGVRRKDSSAAPSGSSSRRGSSFWIPSAVQRAASDIGAPKRRAEVVSPVTEPEYNVSAWDRSASSCSVVDWDAEFGTTAVGLVSRANEAPLFARWTLLWIRGHHP